MLTHKSFFPLRVGLVDQRLPPLRIHLPPPTLWSDTSLCAQACPCDTTLIARLAVNLQRAETIWEIFILSVPTTGPGTA
jgi:hypothetical protein